MIKRYNLLLLLLLHFTSIYGQGNYQNTSSEYSPDSLHRLYIIGLQYFNNGDLTQAEIAFKSILAFPFLQKDWRTIRYYKGKAYVQLGDIYFIQKRYPNAIAQYQNVITEYVELENYSLVLYKLGRSLILNKQAKQGIDILKEYTIQYGSQDKLADNSLYWIAQGYLAQNNNIAAVNTLNQILKDYPDTGMAYDIRKLITTLELSPNTNVDNLKTQNNSTIATQNQTIERMAEEKELIDKIKQLLSLKEQLLQLKETKLDLLESAGKSRKKLLQEIGIKIH